MRGVSLTHPLLPSFLCRDFLLHITCWLLVFFFSFFLLFFLFLESFSYASSVHFFFYLGNFSYKSRAGFIFYLGSFSYTSRAGLIFMWGVSLTHPMPALILSGTFPALTHPMASFLSGEFPLQTPLCNLGSFSYTSRAGFFSLTGVSLTHLVLVSFLSGGFLLHIPYRLLF